MIAVDMTVDTRNPTTLQDAIDHLHQKVEVEGNPQSKARLDQLATYCSEQLEIRDIPGSQPDVDLNAHSRTKEWDVVYHPDRPRLAISLKSILGNISGTVPNRGDGLQGEVVDLQRAHPEIVVGYIVIMPPHETDRYGVSWADKYEGRLDRITGRTKPDWVDRLPNGVDFPWEAGKVEASQIIRIDFDGDGPQLLTDESEMEEFFDVLASKTKERKPAGIHLTSY